MKKLVLILVLFLVIGNVCALEKTKIFGRADPNTKLTLTVDYYAEGVEYKQLVTKQTDSFGLWEYTCNSDPGTIILSVAYRGAVKEYSIPVGTEYEINLITSSAAPPENNTAAAVTNTSEDNAVVNEDNTTQEKTAGVTGKSIFESIGAAKGITIFALIVGFFVLLLIANLASNSIMSAVRRRKYGSEQKSEDIKVIKLSDMRNDEKAREEEQKRKEIEVRKDSLMRGIDNLKQELDSLDKNVK